MSSIPAHVCYRVVRPSEMAALVGGEVLQPSGGPCEEMAAPP